MIKTATHQQISFDSGSKLSLDIASNRITISETNGGDQVTISGINDDAIGRDADQYPSPD
jgi:hypothetical protein